MGCHNNASTGGRAIKNTALCRSVCVCEWEWLLSYSTEPLEKHVWEKDGKTHYAGMSEGIQQKRAGEKDVLNSPLKGEAEREIEKD